MIADTINELLAQHVMNRNLDDLATFSIYEDEKIWHNWNPYEDLNDAFEVVAQVSKKTNWWEMARRPSKDGNGAKVNFMGDPAYDVYGETVAIAICLGALKAVGIEVPQ